MTQNSRDISKLTFITTYEAEKSKELAPYHPNELGIFALAMQLGIDDIDQFAADAITDGGNDKKLDICFIDINEGRAVIAQNLEKVQWGMFSAPLPKANDLNTAVIWLFSSSEDDLPPHIKDRTIELRRAIQANEITEISIYYIHNCWENPNVEEELKASANAARSLVKSLVDSPENEIIVTSKELGLNRIEALYLSQDREILVDKWIDVPVNEKDHEKEQGADWKAILTSVPGSWIQELFKEHQESLFSANYRDYLGSRAGKRNINREITNTADTDPKNFWVYNNGITVLTYELQLEPTVKIRGISIINGAQTTGALSEAKDEETQKTKVLLRIVECNKSSVIDKIIRYNNTQNAIKPADRKSNDEVQHKLQTEFQKYKIVYAHRRGKRIARNAITINTIAAALCAFHGDPQTAYRNSNDIFEHDPTYKDVFPKRLSAEHVFLVRALSIAIDELKTYLKNKTSQNGATVIEKQQYEVLKFSASRFFMLYLIGILAEEIMGRQITDLFDWKAKDNVITPENRSLVKAWADILQTFLPQISTELMLIGPTAFYEVPRSSEESKKLALKFKGHVAGFAHTYRDLFNEIRKRSIT